MADLIKGNWVFRNVLKHQNDYWVARIGSFDKINVVFDIFFSMSKYSSSKIFFGRAYKTRSFPMYSVRDSWKNLKNSKELKKKPSDLKRAMIEASFKLND